MRANSGGRVVVGDPTRTRKSERDAGSHQEAVHVCLSSCIYATRRLQPRGNVMTRIHQPVSSNKHQRPRQLSLRYVRGAQHAIWMFVVMAFLASMVLAQSSSQLNGSVQDPSGASVANAKITLTDAATGFERSTTSNSAGLYQFLEVPPGDYRLQATATGFAPYTATKVTLVVKTPSTVNIKFQ